MQPQSSDGKTGPGEVDVPVLTLGSSCSRVCRFQTLHSEEKHRDREHTDVREKTQRKGIQVLVLYRSQLGLFQVEDASPLVTSTLQL